MVLRSNLSFLSQHPDLLELEFIQLFSIYSTYHLRLHKIRSRNLRLRFVISTFEIRLWKIRLVVFEQVLSEHNEDRDDNACSPCRERVGIR